MTEEEWFSSSSPFDMLCYLKSRSGRARLRKTFGKDNTLRKLRLFLLACSRRIEHLMTDPRSRGVLIAVSKFIDDATTQEDLCLAHEEAAAAYKELRKTNDIPAYCAACTAEEVSQPDFGWKNAFSVCMYGADVAAMGATVNQGKSSQSSEEAIQAAYLREIFTAGLNIPLEISTLQSAGVVELARTMYLRSQFDRYQDLLLRLIEAGCTNESILQHCRQTDEHIQGCWLLDAILDN